MRGASRHTGVMVRLSLVGLNLLALAALMGAAWLLYSSTQETVPLNEDGRNVLFGVFAAGALASLIAVLQFSGKRRMRAWWAITPMFIGFVLLTAGFVWLIASAMVPT